MKKIIIYIALIFIISCNGSPNWEGNAGIMNNNQIIHNRYQQFSTLDIYCLLDFLVGEDPGGEWTQIGTTPEDISALLIGDNPCIDWTPLACGQYELKYLVGDKCCQDSTIVRPLKCCLEGSSICN